MGEKKINFFTKLNLTFMGKSSDRNSDYMREMWGTSHLITDYVSDNKNLIREVVNDDYDVKTHQFDVQNELHEKIRNDEDYDDWEYGTEPIPLSEWKVDK